MLGGARYGCTGTAVQPLQICALGRGREASYIYIESINLESSPQGKSMFDTRFRSRSRKETRTSAPTDAATSESEPDQRRTRIVPAPTRPSGLMLPRILIACYYCAILCGSAAGFSLPRLTRSGTVVQERTGTVHSSASSAGTASLGFAFSPAGLLFPYYVGIGFQLKELGLIKQSSPVGGSSAGSIVAAALACGVPERDVLAALQELLVEVRAGVGLNPALRKQLDLLLTEDSVQRAQEHGLVMCYVEVLPLPRRRIVTEWSSKQDLIDCICASCNWPLFFSRWPLVWCRGALCADGFFAVSRSRFGCPPLPAERVVAITALPKVELAAFTEDDIIQPGRGNGRELPMDSAEWFKYAMAPASDTTVDEMVALGRAHARLWADANQDDSLQEGAATSA